MPGFPALPGPTIRELADHFLQTLGVPVNTTNEAVVMAWILQEGTYGNGYGNPLNVNRYGPFGGAMGRNANGSPNYGSAIAGMDFAANVIKSNVPSNYAGEGDIYKALLASNGPQAVLAISKSGWSGNSHYGIQGTDVTTSHLWTNYVKYSGDSTSTGGSSGAGTGGGNSGGTEPQPGGGNPISDFLNSVGTTINSVLINLTAGAIGVLLIIFGLKMLTSGEGASDSIKSIARSMGSIAAGGMAAGAAAGAAPASAATAGAASRAAPVVRTRPTMFAGDSPMATPNVNVNDVASGGTPSAEDIRPKPKRGPTRNPEQLRQHYAELREQRAERARLRSFSAEGSGA